MSAKFSFFRFARVVSVIDLRSDEDTRRARCEAFAKRNKTCGRVASFL